MHLPLYVSHELPGWSGINGDGFCAPSCYFLLPVSVFLEILPEHESCGLVRILGPAALCPERATAVIFASVPGSGHKPTCLDLQLRPVQEHRFFVCFPHPFQLAHKWIEQILHHFLTMSCAKLGEGAVIRNFLVLQQPSEVDPVLTCLLRFPAGVAPTQIAVYQYLEQHPWSRRRFSSFG